MRCGTSKHGACVIHESRLSGETVIGNETGESAHVVIDRRSERALIDTRGAAACFEILRSTRAAPALSPIVKLSLSSRGRSAILAGKYASGCHGGRPAESTANGRDSGRLDEKRPIVRSGLQPVRDLRSPSLSGRINDPQIPLTRLL